MRRYLQREIVGYFAGILGVLVVGLIAAPLYRGARVLTWGNLLMMVVLLVALTWGMRPAFVTSVLGALYVFSFVFHVRNIEVGIGLLVFLISSVTVSQLSTRAQHRAKENERLNYQLRAAFERTSELETIKRSERLKAAILDSVTHDLRTPLTSIKAASTAIIDIRKRNPTPSVETQASENGLLNIIVEQSDRLNRFIKGMIELATVEAAGPDLAGSTFVEEALDRGLARAADVLRKHKVIVECNDDLRAAVNAKAISQVLFSLLENAAKYSPEASTVHVVAERHGDKNIQITVEDEGPGIAVGIREKIFDKFFRGNGTDTQYVEITGLGLGLAIARGIVEGHGGQIWVEGGHTGGARFVFTLPADQNTTVNQNEREVPCQ